MTGKLARQNAMRNPRRTASTASALMVGVGVVTLFTVLAASVKVAIDDTVSKQFGGDLVINSNDFSSAGMSPQLASDIGQLPQVKTASGLGIGTMTLDRPASDVTVVDPPTFAPLLDIGVEQGSLATMNDPPDRGVGADREGSQVARSVTRSRERSPTDNASEQFTIGAIYKSTELAGDYLIPAAAWTPHAAQPFDIVVMIDLAEGRLDGRRQGGGATGGAQVLRARRADPPGVRRLGREPDRSVPDDRVRLADPRDHHRADGHREHAVAVGVRAHAGARSAAGGRPDAQSAASDGAVGVGDRRGVRDGRWRARRVVPGLGICWR